MAMAMAMVIAMDVQLIHRCLSVFHSSLLHQRIAVVDAFDMNNNRSLCHDNKVVLPLFLHDTQRVSHLQEMAIASFRALYARHGRCRPTRTVMGMGMVMVTEMVIGMVMGMVMCVPAWAVAMRPSS